MSLPIKVIGDPVLREKTKETKLDDPALEKLVSDMEKTLREAEGVGLATSQIGVLKRVIIFDVGDGLKVLINPEIVWKSEEEVEEEEGCLSIPGAKVSVKRAAKVRIKGRDLTGKPVELNAEGLLARVLQHEIDHLNGVLIIDRTSSEERRRVLGEMVGP